MAWEHRLAKELKKRDNPALPTFLKGTVVSEDPLVVSAYDGRVMLRQEAGQLLRVDPWVRCTAWLGCTPKDGATCDHSGREVLSRCAGCGQGRCLEPRPLEAGQEVALLGAQVYFILGVIA